jgi:hypothetical protein
MESESDALLVGAVRLVQQLHSLDHVLHLSGVLNLFANHGEPTGTERREGGRRATTTTDGSNNNNNRS